MFFTSVRDTRTCSYAGDKKLADGERLAVRGRRWDTDKQRVWKERSWDAGTSGGVGPSQEVG